MGAACGSLVRLATRPLLVSLLASASVTSVSAPARATQSFVTRTGSHLVVGSSTFRFSGANVYWLALMNDGTYPSQYEVDDALGTVAEMGGTVVRTWGALSVGCATCLEPSPGVFSEVAFQHLDLVLAEAAKFGIRVILPLVNNYDDGPYGSWRNYEQWSGDTSGTASNFYSAANEISLFEAHIGAVLNRVNSYTGVRYASDPTILAWETGNEIGPTVAWTSQVSSYIKAQDSNHLVMDGTYGISDGNTQWGTAPRQVPETCPNAQSALCLPNVDLYSNHFYPMNASLTANDADAVASVGKAFVAGEYAWNNVGGGDSLASFLSTIETDANVSGDLYWSLWPHADNYGYVQHADGYTLHYPGDNSDMATRAQQLRTHAYQMQAVTQPSHVAAATPTITSVTNARKIEWSGVVGANRYSVQVSTISSAGPWTTICNACATDNSTPWQDPQTQNAVPRWYRVQATNLDGVAGAWSAVYQWPL